MSDLNVLNSKDSIILCPQNILELFSPKTLQMGEMNLSDIYCFADDSIFVVIDSNEENPLNAAPSKFPKILRNREKSSELPTRSATETKHVS